MGRIEGYGEGWRKGFDAGHEAQGEGTYTENQIQQAVYDVLDSNQFSLWLPKPSKSSTPHGNIHPEDIGHIGRWVIEKLRGQ